MDRGVPDMPGELVSEEVGIFLKSKVSQMLRTRIRDFPGSQPVSFTRDHLYNNLYNRDYLVCEKSDGLRCLLLVLINQDTGEEGTFLINRENQYYMVPGFHFPKNSKNFDVSHNGTIVDGELVFSTNQVTGIKELRYLIFDCLAMDMNSVMQKNLWKRLYHAQHDFHKPYMELRRAFPDACAQFPFKLDFKNMTQPFKIRKIFKEMKNLTYVSDGLILTCCDTPYCPGTDSTLLKWKPAEENTIDFKIGLRFPSYIDPDLPNNDPNKEYTNYDAKPFVKLYIWKGSNNNNNNSNNTTTSNGNKQNGGLEDSINYKNSFDEYEEYDDLEISDEIWENWKNSGESFNGRIAEVRRNSDGKWEYLRFRDDKLNGNYYTIVLKILKSIEDAVSKEELINAEKDIWENWQKREKHKKEIQQQQQQNPHHHPPQQQQEQSQQQQQQQQQQQHANHVDHPQHHHRESQPHRMEVPVTDATKKRSHDGVPVTSSTTRDDHGDEDDDYESDGFEEIPTYNRESPKYGDMDHENKKKKY
ncbi:hypothetical protein B5S33_g1072 [[Candida] boidinii]|nr:hypothetical protein B5S33_g1072 [[Candida] boidinii]